MSDEKKAPNVIYLQDVGASEPFGCWDATTWCVDKINEDDVEYVRTPDSITLAALFWTARNAGTTLEAFIPIARQLLKGEILKDD